jgi:hypothetical protein
VAGDIDDFADEEQTGNRTAFHGLAGEFTSVNAAGGDLSFLVALGSRGDDRPGVDLLLEGGESGVGEGAWLVEFEPAGGEASGEEFLKSMAGRGGIAGFGAANGSAGVAFGGEIEGNGLTRFPVGGDLQNGGTTETAVGKEHLFAKAVMIDGGNDVGRAGAREQGGWE